MQIYYYFCIVKSFFAIILLVANFSLDEIIGDIYNAASELSEVDYEQLQSDLYAIHESPIDLNHTSDEELSQLYFLSPQQIDDILLYAEKHPFESLYELRMIPSLADYEIRDLLPFVMLTKSQDHEITKIYPREVFSHATQELITRVDARNIESFEGSDPVYMQTRYRFDYQRRVTFGAQLRRPQGGQAKDLQYGMYLQLKDIAPHLHTLVGGNFQASFGQGLVLAPVFRSGKSMYVTSVGQQPQGLRYYSSVDGEGLHGLGTTLRWEWGKETRLDASVLYSMKHYNDSVWHHLVGANLTFRHKRLEVQLTAIENIYSDSIHPYRNAKYNRHYFRGRNQFVGGASFRFNYGWFDLFGELATAQNKENLSTFNSQLSTSAKWGIGTLIGCRFYPISGLSFIALYRYYSPFFDNALGYAFSETSRLGDENGGYLGFEISRWRNWRITGYGDVFYFSGYKYGLGNDTCTLGYDAVIDARYNGITSYRHNEYWLDLRLRAKKKGNVSTYSLRAQFNYQSGSLSLRTTGEANLVPLHDNAITSSRNNVSYGLTIYQDISYDFTPYTVRHTPISLKLRLQAFDAREWANRIYIYEHDVLYAYSIPATYGLGGRAYLCLRWQIIPQLTLYLRASETLYARNWYLEKHPKSPFINHQSQIPSRTDIHLLLRAKL